MPILRTSAPALLLILAASAGAAQPRLPAARRSGGQADSCPAIRPFSADRTAPGGARAVAVSYHGIADMWRIDSAYVRRDVARYLARNPGVLGKLAGGLRRCTETRCACPTPPPVATASYKRSASDLITDAFQSDSSSTYIALATFFARRPALVVSLADSVKANGSSKTRKAVAAAEQASSAVARGRP